jgi:hypothetical protein
MKYESIAIPQQSLVTISGSDLTAIESALGVNIRTAGPVTIPAGQEHVIIETAL